MRDSVVGRTRQLLLVPRRGVVRPRDRRHAADLVQRAVGAGSTARENERLVEALLEGRLVAIERTEDRAIDRGNAWCAPLLTSLAGGGE